MCPFILVPCPWSHFAFAQPRSRESQNTRGRSDISFAIWPDRPVFLNGSLTMLDRLSSWVVFSGGFAAQAKEQQQQHFLIMQPYGHVF